MITIQLVQVNYQYGSNVYLPYSVGCIESFIRNDEALADKVRFCEPLFCRDDIPSTVKLIGEVEILGLSCYIWNWEYSKRLGVEYRKANPHALIVVGGPQVPLQDKDLFRTELPFADVVVVGEGEIAFSKIAKSVIDDSPLSEIPGLLIPEGKSRCVFSTGAPIRIDDVHALPSPYTTGVFDQIVASRPDLQFQASQETHRGCPYACTFCDWGSATMTRVRRLNPDRILAEYEWMGANRIELLYNCDANYGLFKEDVMLTEALVATNSKFGFPKKFRAAYAKNSNERVFEIAKILNDANMCKGVTLSLQSTDENVLRVIKRKNMKINRFAELVEVYKTAHIPTYTELIIALPGESLHSFCHGLDEMLEAGQHDSLNIYHAMVLPNAELNDPDYRALHQIRSVKTPLLLLHGSSESDEIIEYNEIVIETKTMTLNDWIKATTLAYTIQAFHSLNITQKIAIVIRRVLDIKYSDFYQSLIDWAISSGEGPGPIMRQINRCCVDVANGHGSFDLAENRFGPIIWPTEEALYLGTITQDGKQWLEHFLTESFGDRLNQQVIDELIRYQVHSSIYPFQSDDTSFSLTIDIPSVLQGSSDVLTPFTNGLSKQFHVSGQQRKWNSQADYAREVVWYGRKGTALENEICEL